MIAKASELARAQGIANCRFQRMDAEQFALEDATFDVALCALGLMYAPDPERAVTEMNRVLKPDGRAVSAVWGERRNCGWADIFPIVDARVQSEVCPMFFRIGTGDCLERAYAAAGFSNIRSRRFRTTLDYASAAQACEAAFVGGPVALAHSRFTESMKAEACAVYLASIEAYRTGDGYAVPGE
jgi:ubiquinone/menaquinone biosynthesis C-methylase UbiE